MTSLFRAEITLMEGQSITPYTNFEYYIVAKDAQSALTKAYDAAEKQTKLYEKGELVLKTLERISDEVVI